MEVLCRPAEARRLEDLLLEASSTIGVRRTVLERRALAREARQVEVDGHAVAVKVVRLPSGLERAKPEFDDVQRVAEATGRPAADIFQDARRAAERR